MGPHPTDRHAAHRSRGSRHHRRTPGRPSTSAHPPALTEEPESDSLTTESTSVEPLGDDYYEHGIAARKHAPHTLGGVTSALDEIEDRADQLLAELLELIEGPL